MTSSLDVKENLVAIAVAIIKESVKDYRQAGKSIKEDPEKYENLLVPFFQDRAFLKGSPIVWSLTDGDSLVNALDRELGFSEEEISALKKETKRLLSSKRVSHLE